MLSTRLINPTVDTPLRVHLADASAALRMPTKLPILFLRAADGFHRECPRERSMCARTGHVIGVAPCICTCWTESGSPERRGKRPVFPCDRCERGAGQRTPPPPRTAGLRLPSPAARAPLSLVPLSIDHSSTRPCYSWPVPIQKPNPRFSLFISLA